MLDRKQKMSKILGMCFLTVIFGMLIIGILIPDRKYSAAENRALQSFPKFSLTEYLDGRFESKIDDYVDDQIPGRDQFIKVKAAADETVGVLENNGVYRGKDGYLMENLTVPNPKNLTETEEALQKFSRSHSKLKMHFMLIPNAGNVLSEHLPKTVRMADQNQQMDDFFQAITGYGIKPVDVREAFRKEKNDVQLYYRTDHHWTSDGAYLAYENSIRALTGDKPKDFGSKVVKEDFQGTLYSKSGFNNGQNDIIKLYQPTGKQAEKSVIYYTDTQKKTTAFYNLKNLKKKDAYTVFGGSNHPMYTVETPVANQKRLLLIKDSYANSFVPFLTQHYREIVVVDPRYYFENLEDLIQSEKITDVLFLYNANTFFGDDALKIMLADTK